MPRRRAHSSLSDDIKETMTEARTREMDAYFRKFTKSAINLVVQEFGIDVFKKDIFKRIEHDSRLTPEENEKKAEKIAKDIAQSNINLTTRRKRRHRYETKAAKSGGAADVPDVLGIQILYPDVDFILALRHILSDKKLSSQLRQAFPGVVDIKVDDSFLHRKKHGFVGYAWQVKIKLPGMDLPVPCEIKFLHRDMQNTDNYTHAIYEEMRAIRDQAKIEKRALTPFEQRMIDRDEKMIKDVYDLDIENPKYKLKLLMANQKALKPPASPAQRRHEALSRRGSPKALDHP